MRILLPFILIAIPVGAVADDAKLPEPQVSLELVSEVDALVPGETATVALRLVHEPGWHTYWKNPGTVGLAPSIEWTLPEGYTAGPIVWQQPQLTKMAAYTVWGYEGEALLLTEITVPESAAPGSTVALRANVTYMACAKACCPDEKKLLLKLPVRAVANPRGDWPVKFDAVRKQQPRRIAGWRSNATRSGDIYTLTLTPPAGVNIDEATLYFFNDDRLVSSDAPQKVHRDDDRIVLTLRGEAHTPGEGDTLRGHVYRPGGLDRNKRITALRINTHIVDQD